MIVGGMSGAEFKLGSGSVDMGRKKGREDRTDLDSAQVEG